MQSYIRAIAPSVAQLIKGQCLKQINNSIRYETELQFDLKGTGDDMECYAYAIDHGGHKVIGPTITMKMAKAEGWLDRNGSKWKTMPEIKIRYRAASFFGRLNCPDMVMGIYTADEVIDLPSDSYNVVDVTDTMPSETISPRASELEPGELNMPNSQIKEKLTDKINRADKPAGDAVEVKQEAPQSDGMSPICADCKVTITRRGR